MLDSFNIIQNYAPDNFIYDNKLKKLKKKFLIVIDKFSSKKFFFKEKINKLNNLKIPKNYTNLLNDSFSNNIFMFKEILKLRYFNNYQDELSFFFVPKKELIKHNKEIIHKLISTNSISIHIRRNRFSDQIGLTDTINNKEKSDFLPIKLLIMLIDQ